MPHRMCSRLMLVVLVACASEGIPGPPTGLAHAGATRACGPTDGPAVAIYLAPAPVESLEPSAPYLRIHIWQPVDRLTERLWIVSGGEADGAAWRHSTGADYEIATSGTVTVNAVAADSTIEGLADLRFPRGGRIRGGFRAAWLPRSVLCG